MKKPVYVFLCWISCFSACSEQARKPIAQKKEISFQDSIRIILAKIDTSKIEGKRQYIKYRFLEENQLAFQSDTLLDLNYDQQLDYVIFYERTSGSGLRKMMLAYLFQIEKQNYTKDTFFSYLPNPSFFLNRKQITSFYLGQGTGDGKLMEWRQNRWQVIKTFTTNNQMEDTVWIIDYPLAGKQEKIKAKYHYKPPKEVLESIY